MGCDKNDEAIVLKRALALVRAPADDPEGIEVVFFAATRFKVLTVDLDADRSERTVYLSEIPSPRLTRAV